MIKEEIMDIDEEDNQNSESVVKKEPALRPKSNDFKYKLLERLENSDSSLTQNLTLAITIQTMFNKDPEVLERLFRFFIDQKQMEMALDLWENDIIKRFNLSAVAEFDVHLKRIVTQIIFHLSVKALSEREKKQLTKLEIDPIDEFYLELFLKLSQPSQEKLVTQLLDKYRNGFSFLKISSTEAVNVKKEQPTLQQSIDIREFYSKLIEVKDTIFTTRSLLTIYKKFIPDYGLFLIDGFLNIEKQLFANLIQNSSQTEQILSNIEKRSLNVIRRICVVDLIPEFIYLIDKLDNRHCYRWIEKSLEFFTKYTLNSIEAKMETSINGGGRRFVKIGYENVRLLNDLELYSVSEDKQVYNERIEFLNQNLRDLVDYKYVADSNNTDNSPFQHVYKLLDEIGKKLEWPTLPNNLKNSSFLDSDNKLSYLLNLKAKAIETKSTTISVSSLNKQISFYGIALFFQRLIEFNSLAKEFFSDNLLMIRKFDLVVKKNFMDSLKPTHSGNQWYEPIDLAISTLVYCLKLWQKFNSHKEFSTIVTKCLSNSKLDSLTFYKNFLNEYYTVYSSTLNPANSPVASWESFQSLTSLKQKIPVLVNLFINETTSFDKIFAEFNAILSHLTLTTSNEYRSSGEIILSNNQFEAFELSMNNTLEYISRLVIEKLYQQLVLKNTNVLKYMSESDEVMGHLVVLVQINLSENAPHYILEFYDIIFQVIKAKASFDYPGFLDYIYDVQILQDFLSLINASNITEKNTIWILDITKTEDIEVLKNKFYSQVNSDKSSNKYTLLDSFYKKNGKSLADHFNMMFKN